MIKNDLRYIIRRIITAIAIAFVLFFLKSNHVLAATSVSAYHYRLDYNQGYCSTTSYSSCSFDTSNFYLTSFIPFGTSTNPNQIFSNNYLYNAINIRSFYVRLDTGTSSSTDFVSGQIYTLKFTLNLAPRPTNFYASVNRNVLIQTWNGSAYVNNTAEVLTVDIQENTSDNYGTNFVITFRVNVQTRYVLLNFGLLDSLRRQRDEGINFKADASTQVSSDATIQAIYDAASSIINNIISQTTTIIETAATNNTNLNDIKSLILNIINVTYDNIYTGGLSQWKNDLETNSSTNNGLTDDVNLPGMFIGIYQSGFNSQCQRIDIGSWFGTTIYLPCFEPEDFFGSTLWATIDLLFATFMIYNISRRFVQMFNKITNLETDQINDLYGGGV